MALRLTLVFQNRKLDIQVNREQKIIETLEILADSGQLELDGNIEGIMLHSMRRKERINIRLTYEQAQLYMGDILYLDKVDRIERRVQGDWKDGTEL